MYQSSHGPVHSGWWFVNINRHGKGLLKPSENPIANGLQPTSNGSNDKVHWTEGSLSTVVGLSMENALHSDTRPLFRPRPLARFPARPLPSPSGRFSSSATGYSEPDAKRARGQARALRSGSVFRTVRSFVRLRSFVQGRRIAHMLRWGRKAAAKVHSAHFPTLSHFVPCFLLPAAQLRWIS